MPLNTPKVSIVVPTKDRLFLLKLTVTSIQNQTDCRWECLFVDDGSSKDTILWMKNTCQSDPRFRLIEKDFSNSSGACASRNLGLNHSRASLIIFLDSDDLLPNDRVAKSIDLHQKAPELDAVIFQYANFSFQPGDMAFTSNSSTEDDNSALFLKTRNPWMTTCPTWRKTTLLQIEGWNEKAQVWQDWELHVRALAAGLCYQIVPDMGYYFRQHPLSRISNHESKTDRWLHISDTFLLLIEKLPRNQWRRDYLHPLEFLAVQISEKLIQTGSTGAHNFFDRCCKQLETPFLTRLFLRFFLFARRVELGISWRLEMLPRWVLGPDYSGSLPPEF